MLRIGRWFTGVDREKSPSANGHLPDVVAVHTQYAEFVFRSLQRLGVRPADLDDLRQEVFIIVHKRLHTFDRSGSMTAWLFGICRKVADRYRRRAHVRRETTEMGLPDTSTEDMFLDPEETVAQQQARAELGELLDELDLDKRAVLVMFEIDQMDCEEIAEILGVPVGTVYSRLHRARKSFEKALARRDARLAQGGR